MATQLIPFSFESHEIRVVTDESGNPLFVAKDVCVALGYKDPTTAVKSHCKGVQELHPLQTAGGKQEVRVIREPDLYRLIVGSSLPEAERFERWVFEDVLPTIRKTGQYTAKGAVHSPETLQEKAAFVRTIANTFGDYVKIAKLCGLKGNHAVLSADRGIREATGVSPLKMIGAELQADPRGMTYTPTELGQLFNPPLTAIKINKKLELAGLQGKEAGHWIPTDKAIGLYEWLDTGKKHSDGTPIKQLKWFQSALPELAVKGEAA